MTCIVAYDIEEDKIRTKLARFLQYKEGARIQKSVFAVNIERHQFKRFLAEMKKLVKEKDRIAVFRLCMGCEKNAIQVSEEEPMFYVF